MFFYTFLPQLLNMSLTASMIILFVLLLRLLLKNAPKVFSYALWSVVLFRLLCPVSIQSDLSLFALLDVPVSSSSPITSKIEYIPANIVHSEFPSVTLPILGIDEKINDALPQGEEQLVADPLEAPIAIATYLWIAGVLAMSIYAVISYMRLHKKLVTASPLRKNIYLVDDISSPFVLGLFRPKIYLPSSLTEQEHPYIIQHEQYHIRRLDHVAKALAFVALCIHWFNPLVWLAFLLASKDMEMSCDEAVIQKMGDSILADYATSLLHLATGKHNVIGMPLTFSKGDIKSRIRNLANWKKPKRLIYAAAGLIVILSILTFLFNPSSVPLTKLDIAEANINTVLANLQFMTISYHDDTISCDRGVANRFVSTMNKIRVNQKPLSQDRSETRSRSFVITINGNLKLCFSDDFSEIWLDNGVKPSFSYPILNPDIAEELLLDFRFTQNDSGQSVTQ